MYVFECVMWACVCTCIHAGRTVMSEKLSKHSKMLRKHHWALKLQVTHFLLWSLSQFAITNYFSTQKSHIERHQQNNAAAKTDTGVGGWLQWISYDSRQCASISRGIERTCRRGHRASVGDTRGIREWRHGSRSLQIYNCCPDFQKRGTGECQSQDPKAHVINPSVNSRIDY